MRKKLHAALSGKDYWLVDAIVDAIEAARGVVDADEDEVQLRVASLESQLDSLEKILETGGK
jgi:hypothetical protein